MLIVDEEGTFNRIWVDEVIKPKKFDVRPLTVNPELEQLFKPKKERELDHLAFTYQLLKACGFKTKTILQMMNYRGKGALERLKNTPVDEDALKRAVEQVRNGLIELNLVFTAIGAIIVIYGSLRSGSRE